MSAGRVFLRKFLFYFSFEVPGNAGTSTPISSVFTTGCNFWESLADDEPSDNNLVPGGLVKLALILRFG